MCTTHTLKRIIAGTLLSGGVAVAGFGLSAGVAQAEPTCPDSPYFCWCPGKPLPKSGTPITWDMSCLLYTSRFRLLTGGARTAVPRQQTLRASVDWSHDLLTGPEAVLLRRLAVFLGGFDLVAARAVAGGADVERFQVLDQLTLLVDKSLVVAEDSAGRNRYRLLETVRQYALEKLGESGEVDLVRARHRDYYTDVYKRQAMNGDHVVAVWMRRRDLDDAHPVVGGVLDRFAQQQRQDLRRAVAEDQR